MITLTEEAIRAMKDLSRNQAHPNNRFRATATGSYYSVDPEDEVAYRDEVFDVDGVTVIIDSSSMLFLEGAEIDYRDTPEGRGFTFSGPNILPQRSESSTHASKPDPKAYTQSMPCRIDRNQERQYATKLSALSPGDVVAFPYDDVRYEAVVQRINATNATVTITKIAGSPRRCIVVGEKVHVAASILARRMDNP
jgi:iron-sulfur cluster assembly protein